MWEREREQDRGNNTIMLQKPWNWEKTFPKALNFSDCLESIPRQIHSSYKKKYYDFVKCLHRLVLWKLRNLDTRVNFRIEFTMFEKSNLKRLAQREKTK